MQNQSWIMKTILFIAGALLFVYISYRTYRIITLDKGLDEKVAKGALILDVRTVAEYNTGHIEGSVNIPLSHLHKDNIPLDKGRVIITCCSHGLRSVKAVNLLKQHGFSQVYNGGAWVDLEQSIKKAK